MSSIWAIADLHLSLGISGKEMDIFGEQWVSHYKKIETSWRKVITDNDLILVAGDISWAKNLEEVKKDLAWLDSLPGTKVMIKGNHDYWWHALSKVKAVLPPSCHVIQNDHFNWKEISIGGTRLWDSNEFTFQDIVDFQGKAEEQLPENEKIFDREIHRLELSLKSLDQNARLRIAMTHYPPISADLRLSRASLLFEKYHVNIVVFGHLHNVKKGLSLFGVKNGIQYVLTSSDYLNFVPIKVATL